MENCIFCKLVKNEISAKIIEENEEAIAFLDINPAANGHILVIPKKHYRNFGLTDIKSIEAMMRLAKNITYVLEEVFPEIIGFNYLMNSNEGAGQVVMHTHLHIIPKYTKDEGFMFSAKKNEQEMMNVETVHKKVTTKLKSMKRSMLSKHFMV